MGEYPAEYWVRGAARTGRMSSRILGQGSSQYMGEYPAEYWVRGAAITLGNIQQNIGSRE
jgi:hypothetical protein